MTIVSIIAIFLGTMTASFALTLLVRAVAPRIGLTDRPDGRRKLHVRAIPLGGGLAVFVATAAAVLGLLFLPNPWQGSMLSHTRSLLGMLAAGLAIVALGLADDRFGLRGRHKLLGQFAVALCLAVNGLYIDHLFIFGHNLDLGMLAIPLTVVWLLGAMNAINLLDGIDGMASVLGIILAATFAVIACILGRPEIALVAMVFSAALLGFAWLNFPPASIFLGDTGSMLIGLLLGILAVKGAMKWSGTALLAAPLAVWTLPIFDSLAAILRRKLTGRSIYETDRGHLHHRLMDRLGSNSLVLCLVGACCTVTSVAATVSVALRNDLVAVLVSGAVVAMFIATGLFGRAECSLLVNRFRGLLRSFFRLGRPAEVSESSVQLQGSIQWERIWNALTESADKLMLRRIRLNVNVPLLHEGFNAHWEQPSQDDNQNCWQLEMPLMVAGQYVGQLSLVSRPRRGTADEEIAPLLELVGDCESYLQTVFQTRMEAHQQGRQTAGGKRKVKTGSRRPLEATYASSRMRPRRA